MTYVNPEDRDMLLDLSRAVDLDFLWTAKILYGHVNCAALVGLRLAELTKTPPGLWGPDGDHKARLVAAKTWHLRHGRPSPDSAEQATSARELSPAKTRCRNCE